MESAKGYKQNYLLLSWTRKGFSLLGTCIQQSREHVAQLHQTQDQPFTTEILHTNKSSCKPLSDSVQIHLLKAPDLLEDKQVSRKGNGRELSSACFCIAYSLSTMNSRHHTRYHAPRMYPHCSICCFLVRVAFLKSLLHSKNIFCVWFRNML